MLQDPYFKVILDKNASSPNPELAIWNAQHICVAESQAYKDEPKRDPAEIVIKHQLNGNKGHYSVLAFAKKDSQLEIQVLAQMIQVELGKWCPILSKWYMKHRYGKALLAP